MLIPDYYTILSREQQSQDTYLFTFTLNPGAEVYRGHFPGTPIAPGVCTLQMIRECAETILQQPELHFTRIKQCKFSRLLQPSDQPLQLLITLADDHMLTAEITDQGQTCLKLKSQLSKQ